MEALWAALAATPVAEAMRVSRWGYAAVNTAHVLGLALLVGAILPLDLKLLGWRRGPPVEALAQALVPVAAAGLALAAASGALLFLAGPQDYAAEPVFLMKMGLVALGLGGALALHLGPGISGAGPGRRRLAGALSLLCWATALALGRLLGFL